LSKNTNEKNAKQEMKLPSINKQVASLVRHMIDNADALRITVTKGSLGETLIDCGVDVVGGLEAGRQVSDDR